jgi:Domain of unknown function (DUF4276)
VRRLVCVVEGHGEVLAMPALCYRILQHLKIDGWLVDANPIRQPRSQLVDESIASPNRPCLLRGVDRVVALAHARPASAIVVLCDSDNDCAATWAADLQARAYAAVPLRAVMAVREFESWLVANESKARQSLGSRSAESVSDPKGVLKRAIGEYSPSLDQLPLSRRVDIDLTRTACRSFDKLVRSIEEICT